MLRPGGRFVLGDVILPDDLADATTPVDGVYDRPSRTTDQLQWLVEAGFQSVVAWEQGDLAVLVGQLGVEH